MRRQRAAQAKDRSTTHLRGKSTKPRLALGALTTARSIRCAGRVSRAITGVVLIDEALLHAVIRLRLHGRTQPPDLASIVKRLEAKGVSLKAIEQPVDTSTAARRCFLQMLGVFADFETAIRRERQLEGVAKAKAEGVYKGRKPSIDPERVKALAAQGMGATAIARELNVARASVYRLLNGVTHSSARSGATIRMQGGD